MQEMGLTSFLEYINYVRRIRQGPPPAILSTGFPRTILSLCGKRTIFEFLQNTVLPYIEIKYGGVKDIRMWSAALFHRGGGLHSPNNSKEYFLSKPGWNTQLLATDVSQKVLEKAYDGIYTESNIAPLPLNWRKKYFIKQDNGSYMVTDDIKKNVIYRIFNLMEDSFDFKKKFQVIFCRNVMIYFDSDTRNALINKLYQVLDDGGYLFIGHSESLNHTSTAFKYIMPAVYRKLERQ